MKTRLERIQSLTEVDLNFISECLMSTWRVNHFKAEECTKQLNSGTMNPALRDDVEGKRDTCTIKSNMAKKLINKLDPLYDEASI